MRWTLRWVIRLGCSKGGRRRQLVRLAYCDIAARAIVKRSAVGMRVQQTLSHCCRCGKALSIILIVFGLKMTLPPEALRVPEDLLDSARLLPDRLSMLPLLPKEAIFAEVGVAIGDFSQAVMSVCQPSLFIAIDTFRLHELPLLWGQPSDVFLKGQTHKFAYRSRFADAIGSGKIRVLEGDSATCLEQLGDLSIDIIYLDADHRYEFIQKDLAAARHKVRDNGWIIVNDYIMVAELGDTIPYGVVNATNEFMIEHDWGVQYFALQTRMFCDVALRPKRYLQKSQMGPEALIADNMRLRNEMTALRNSNSWRVTAPLRAIARLLPRVG